MDGDTARTVVMLLAGGAGTRLSILARWRAKPAVPFGGNYRIIDFTLSSVFHSGLEVVGVLTQYVPYSLMAHLRNGEAWGFVGRDREARILPPHTGSLESDWYRGTADAVYQNLSFLRDHSAERVLVVSGDHIYRMDYRALLEYHAAKNADVTVATLRVPMDEASQFGLAVTDDEHRIIEFEEKPEQPRSDLASMGVYVFEADVLVERLQRHVGKAGGVDFARDVIQPMMAGGDRVYAYPFSGYWRDVGTVGAYLEANLDLLRPGSGLDLESWQVRTNLMEPRPGDRPPARFGPRAEQDRARICRGCQIDGRIEESILSPGVRVGEGAVVRRSVLFHDVVVEPGAVLDDVIADKHAVFGKGARVGGGDDVTVNADFPSQVRFGITLVGKRAYVPDGTRVGRNCVIFPLTLGGEYSGAEVTAGSTIGAR